MEMKNTANSESQFFDKVVINGKCPPCAYAKSAWNQCTKDCNTGYQLFTGARTLGKPGCNVQKGERGPTENPKVRLCNTQTCGKTSCADCEYASMGPAAKAGFIGRVA